MNIIYKIIVNSQHKRNNLDIILLHTTTKETIMLLTAIAHISLFFQWPCSQDFYSWALNITDFFLFYSMIIFLRNTNAGTGV